MVQKPEIQYVRYYAEGSAAKVLVRQPVKPQPKVKRKQAPVQRIVIPFDAIAVIGTAVALVLTVLMFVSIFQVSDINREIVRTQQKITLLEQEHADLQAEYDQSYDLEAVRTAAASMGMVPREEAERITVKVEVPAVEEEPSWWESFVADLKELFA